MYLLDVWVHWMYGCTGCMGVQDVWVNCMFRCHGCFCQMSGCIRSINMTGLSGYGHLGTRTMMTIIVVIYAIYVS